MFCNRSETHFIMLKYQSVKQGAASQATSNNLQLCYQKYLSVVCSKQSSILETRKQNYIIIFTSLSGSLMLFRYLQKKFFQQIVENYVEKLLKTK